MVSAPTFAEGAGSFWEVIRPLVLDVVALQKSLLSRHRLSPSQGFTLRYLAVRGPRRVSELAGWSGVSRAAATEHVNGLVRRRWVRRRRDPEDGRSVRIALTPKGRREVERINAEARAVLERAARRFSREELERLSRALADLHAALRAEVPVPAAWPWPEGP